jgi:uncharacterized repeat protein (TIGR01451 family)
MNLNRILLIAVVLCLLIGAPVIAAGRGGMQNALTQTVGGDPADFPICTGFELGTLPNYMFTEFTSVNGGSIGRAQVTANYPHQGQYAFELDTQLLGNGGETRQAGIIMIDLSGVSNAELSFWLLGHGDGAHAEDGVFLSDDEGASYEKVYNVPAGYTPYHLVVFDLIAAANGAGIDTEGVVYVKFQSYDNWGIPTEGFSIDDICIQNKKPHLLPSKEAAAGVMSGDDLTYTVSVHNGGLVAANNVAVTDPIPDGTTYVTGSATNGATYNEGEDQIEWNVTLAAGAQDSFSFAVTVGAAAGEVIENVAAVSHPSQNGTVYAEALTGVYQPAAFPVCESFEFGALPDYMFTEVSATAGANGRAEVREGNALEGLYALHLDADDETRPEVVAAAVMVVDLGGVTEASLSFWVKGYDSTGGEVLISDDGGQTYAEIHELPYVFDYTLVALDLDAEAASVGMSLTDDFQIKFQVQAHDPIDDDGYSIDKVCVQPFQTYLAVRKSASAGMLSGQTVEYSVTIENQGPLTGTTVLMTDPVPAGTTYVPGSASNGATYNSSLNQIEWTGTVGRYSTEVVTFDVTINAASGTTLHNVATVSHASLPGPLQASADTLVTSAAPFETCEGFEGGVLPPYMYVETTEAVDGSAGRVGVRPERAQSGVYALHLDTAPSYGNNIPTTQAAVMIVNLAGVSQAELSFWIWEHLEENHPEDGVFISDDDGVTYNQIFSFNDLPDRYQFVVIDLAQAAADAGMSLTNAFRIKFQAKDDDPMPIDGYSFDVICVQTPKVHLAGEKSAPLVALTGSELLYTVVAQNIGLVDAAAVAVNDPIPAGTSYVPGSATNGATFNSGTNSVQWNGNIGEGQVISFTFRVTADLAQGFVDNVALISHPDVPQAYQAKARTQVASSCGPIDMVFVIDTTSSMDEAIDNVKAEVGSLIGLVDDFSGGDFQLGLVTFKDDVTVWNDLAAGNEAAVQANILALTAGGGGNTPEASDEALNTVIHGLDADDRPPGAQTGDFDGVWRPAAAKLIILITDAPPGGFDDTFTPGEDDENAHDRAEEAAAAGIAISAIYVPTTINETAEAVMEDYAETSGGIYFKAREDGSGTADAIAGIVANCGQPTVDLMVDKDDTADPVTQNSIFAYVLTVTNNGPTAASGVVLTDTIPAGLTVIGATVGCNLGIVCTVGDLAVNESKMYTITVRVNAGAPHGMITNVATATASQLEFLSENNTATETTTIGDLVVRLPVVINTTPAQSAPAEPAGVGETSGRLPGTAPLPAVSVALLLGTPLWFGVVRGKRR